MLLQRTWMSSLVVAKPPSIATRDPTKLNVLRTILQLMNQFRSATPFTGQALEIELERPKPEQLRNGV
jgi:hypothetical protein